MDKKFKIIGSLGVVILAITLISNGIYLKDYYPANESDINLIANINNVTASESNDYIYFEAIGTNNHSIFSKSNSSNLTGKKGLIFYPSGKVASKVYATLTKKISESGYDVVIMKMPFKLAIIGTNKANMIFNEHSDINWIIGDHSLGGSAASSFGKSNPNSINRIVFLAIYPIDNMFDTGIKGLSIVGSNDGVLNKEEFNKAKTKFHMNTDFQVINGGNHAYFGDYGFQSRDNNSSISQATQENEDVNIILKFFEYL